MNSEEIIKLATDEADRQIAAGAPDIRDMLRDTFLAGVLTGSRMAVAQAETYLAVMKAEKK